MKKLILIASLILIVSVVAAQCGVVSEVSLGPQSVVSQLNQATVPQAVPAQTFESPEYIGSEACGECHEDTYTSFMDTGHPYKLNKVVDGQPPEYPFSEVPNPPEGYTWDDITYVIGGYGWKARFIDQEGFIITGDADATTQYNLYNEDLEMGDNWVPYHAGEEKPYDCGTCHTTGYQPEGNQDGLPGLIGTWVEDGIGCEECHGPGSQHADDPYLVGVKVDRDSELCGQCHIRGDVESINASGGFIRHHEQYEEMFESKKRVMNCIACHNPHETTKYSQGLGIRTPCENCHLENAEFQKIASRKHAECVDCHMPRITKSALGDAERHTGDLRTHLMLVWPFDTAQFSEDGSTANPYVALDFSCKGCHYDGGPASVVADEELIEFATGYHDRESSGSAD